MSRGHRGEIVVRHKHRMLARRPHPPQQPRRTQPAPSATKVTIYGCSTRSQYRSANAVFKMVKFRSMYVDAEARRAEREARNVNADGVLFKVRDDPRITPVGRMIRKYSLDELPQLFNVLSGKMSLVGPRPPLPAEVARYADDMRRRLLVKPGITGLWQISGRSDLSWEETKQLDLRYVENWSLGTDLLILWKTPAAVTKACGAY
jgi:lipopolysaccharide/colanic/teichoic acid biosynthesis glycosyltransferase